MQETGYIRLHRSLLNWEWFKSGSMLRIWLYLLMTANWADGRFMGIKVPRGSLITSYPRIAEGTGLSRSTVIRALKKLQETGEITVRTNHRYSHIYITHYDEYQQWYQNETTDGTTGETTDGTTGDTQYKKKNKNKKNKEGSVQSTPPTLDEIREYVKEKGYSISPDRFYSYYQGREWTHASGRKMTNWKATVDSWQADDSTRRDTTKPSGHDHIVVKVPDYIEAQERGEYEKEYKMPWEE